MSLPKFTPILSINPKHLALALSEMTNKTVSVKKDLNYLTIILDQQEIVLPLTTRMNYQHLIESLKDYLQ